MVAFVACVVQACLVLELQWDLKLSADEFFKAHLLHTLRKGEPTAPSLNGSNTRIFLKSGNLARIASH